MNKELYDDMSKALSKGYADRCDQLNALDLIEELQAEVARLRLALEEAHDTLEAEFHNKRSGAWGVIRKIRRDLESLEHKD
jgi:hypothetical protein